MKTIKMDIGHPIVINIELDRAAYIHENRWIELNERINDELPKNRWMSPLMLDGEDKEIIELRASYFCEQDVMYEPKVFGKAKGYTDFRPDLDELIKLLKQFLKELGYEVIKIDIHFDERYDIDITWYPPIFPKEANWEKEVKKIDDITLRKFGTV